MTYHRLFGEDHVNEVKKRKIIGSSKKEAQSEQRRLTAEQEELLLHHQLLGNTHFKEQYFSLLEQQLIWQFRLDCSHEGKELLWQRFEKLTLGQQRSFLADSFGLTKGHYVIPKQQDWLKWEKKLKRLSSMPLEQDEVYKEARKSELHEQGTFFEMTAEQFISPYREVWLWLNYKGNHQNRVDVLRRLEQLPLDHKKWLLHKLMQGKKMSAQGFASQLTIVMYEQSYVDWERIIACLDDLDTKSDQEIAVELEQFQSTEGQTNELNLDMEEFDHLENENERMQGSTFPLLGLILDNVEPNDQPKVEHIRILSLWCKSAEQLRILLFSDALSGSKKINKVDMLAFVDRILMISTALKEEKRKVKREQLLKQYGFVSAIAFATYCLEKIASTLYEQGIVKHQATFKKLILNLGFSQDALPSQEQLLNKLYALYLG